MAPVLGERASKVETVYLTFFRKTNFSIAATGFSVYYHVHGIYRKYITVCTAFIVCTSHCCSTSATTRELPRGCFWRGQYGYHVLHSSWRREASFPSNNYAWGTLRTHCVYKPLHLVGFRIVFFHSRCPLWDMSRFLVQL